ncbi:hypothetical protein [Saccharopolyspora sp. NPDC002376]
MKSTGIRRRLCVAVDVENYGGQDDRRQHAIQESVLSVLDEAATRAELHRDHWERQPQGDGELAVLPETEPEPRLIDDYLRELRFALDRHNQNLRQSARLRLRLAIHFGVAIPASNGFSGQAAVVVSRLRDSQPLRQALAAAIDADLVVMLSDRLYQETVKQGHTSLRPDELRQVSVQEKTFADKAWIYVPSDDVHRLPALDEPRNREADKANRPEPTVVNEFHGTVQAEHATFGVSY